MRPVGNVALRVERSTHFHHHRRAVRLPRKFVFTHPLHSHRPARHGARQQYRVERHIVGAVVAIAARAFGMDHDDIFGRDIQHPGEIAAQRKYALAVRPHRVFAVLELGDGAGRADRCMRDMRARVFRFKPARPGMPAAASPFFADYFIFGWALQQITRIAVLRQCGLLAPLRTARDPALRANRLLLALRNDADKAAVAHDCSHARHRLHFGGIQGDEPGSGPGWTRDAAVEHARQFHILHVTRHAGDFRRNIDARHGLADQGMQFRRFGRDLGGRFARQQIVARQFPVSDAAAAAGRDRAVLDRKLLERAAQLRGGALQQQIAHFRRRIAQRDAGFLDRAAARSHALVGTARSIGRRKSHAFECDVEFIGDHLHQHREYALADLDLARENGDRAVGVEPQPAVEHAVVLEAARQLARCSSRSAHAASPTTRRMARRMRWCVPQRHRLPASASRISVSPGLGLASSRAFADMMMPLAQ